jgi:hypothetical protein
MENLEGRLMLAADLATFQNPFNATDVDNDTHVTPRDALIVINLINVPATRGDVVGGFIDVNDDDFVSPHDALGVINVLNNPETMPVSVADKFDKLVMTLDNVPTELDGKLKLVKDKLVTTQNEIKQAHDVMRAELDDFLEFAVEQHVALEKRFQDLEASMDFSFTIMEREIRETATEFAEINTEMFNENDFDRLETELDVVSVVVAEELNATLLEESSLSIAVPTEFEFLMDDFSWDHVEDLGDGLEALFSDLEDMVSTVDIENPVESLAPEFQDWITELDAGENTLADFMVTQLETPAAEDWLLQGGDDVAALVDAMQADLAENETDFMDFVDDYFTEDSAFIDMVDDLFGECINGEMHHGDQVAIGGETTGSVVEVDDNTLFELDFHDDPQLLEAATALHEQPVMVFGTFYKIEGVEIPERTIMDVKKLIPKKEFSDLADKFKGYTDPVFGSLAGKFEDIYEDNVDHYMDVIADTFSVHSNPASHVDFSPSGTVTGTGTN